MRKGFSYNDSETIVDQGHQQVKFCTSLNSFDAVGGGKESDGKTTEVATFFR